MKPRAWLLACALLPLACAGLLAQEPAAQEPAPTPAPAAEPPAGPGAEPAEPDEPAPPEEQVSADSNLSFPVDI
jgi:hypothetical protein